MLSEVSQPCKRRTAGKGSSRVKDSTKPLPSRKGNPIGTIFKAYTTRESQKFQTQSELFERYYGHMEIYQGSLSSIKTQHQEALADMALAIGDCSAMVLLKQAIEGVRLPPAGVSFHV